MSNRRAHAQAGLAGAAVSVIGIAIAASQVPSLPVLAGALRPRHLVVGTGFALACGWVGARLPDWIEPPRSPRHRGFWHSKTLAGMLLVLSGLLAGGFLLDQARPEVFIFRTAALFLSVGYLTHLGLDLLTSYGLPRLQSPTRAARRLDVPTSAVTVLGTAGLGILAVGITRALWVYLGNLAALGWVWRPLLLGVSLGAALDHFVLHGRAKGLHTFVHEAAHAIAALLLGHKVNRFVSTRSEGGVVQHQGGFGGTVADRIIALAPYFWPTFAVIAVLLRPLIAVEWFPGYDVLIGATAGFHLTTSLRDLRKNSHGNLVDTPWGNQSTQTDIAKSGGLLVSSVCIATGTLVTYSLLIAVIVGGYAGLVQWVEVTGRGAWLAAAALGEHVADVVRVLTG